MFALVVTLLVCRDNTRKQQMLYRFIINKYKYLNSLTKHTENGQLIQNS